nr:MAG TPA: GcrA cell cycle regulator [Caudoviricetes sp.]
MRERKMPVTKNILPEEVRKAKLLLSKGLSVTEVATIIGRSVSAVIKIRNGAYDFMLAESQYDTPDDSRVDILLKSIDSRLYRQNEDMKKAIDQLTGLNATLVELHNEIKVCTTRMAAMLDALNDLKSQNRPQVAPEAPPANKYPGKDFERWGEVIRRVEVYGDKFIADSLRGTKASLDGTTLYLACTPSTKKFLKSSAVAIPRIKQQCRNVIGYGV